MLRLRLRRQGPFDADHGFELSDQPLHSPFPVVEQVNPLPDRKFVGECFVWGNVLDTNRDHDQLALARQHELFFDFL